MARCRVPLFATERALVTGASRGSAGDCREPGARRCRGGDRGPAPIGWKRLPERSKAGRKAHAIALDVSRVADCRNGVAQAQQRMGGLDILVSNAGVEQVAPSLAVTEEIWDRIVDTNLKGAFFTAQAAARAMGRGGAILNLCSLTSTRGIAAAVLLWLFKAGLLGMAGPWQSSGRRSAYVATPIAPRLRRTL